MSSHTLVPFGIFSLLVAANADVMAASAQYGQTTYLPSTIPNIDVWPLGGEQYDGIDLDTCLKKGAGARVPLCELHGGSAALKLAMQSLHSVHHRGRRRRFLQHRLGSLR